MSEQPTAPPGGGGKILGMSRPVFYLAVAGVAVVAGLFYYWQKNRTAQATAAANTASTTAQNSSVDYSGELSVIQTELESIMQTLSTGSGTTTTAPPPPPPPTQTQTGPPVSVAVPNGTGGWMNYTFPNQAALNTFYLNIGVRNGAYPNGLSTAQLVSALQQVGAYPQTAATATPGPGTEAPPPASVGGLPSYGPW